MWKGGNDDRVEIPSFNERNSRIMGDLFCTRCAFSEAVNFL